MRTDLISALPLALVLSVPVNAQEQKVRPIDAEPDALDVATTPLNDLNIRNGEIPALLVAAQQAPYSLTGLDDCTALALEIEKFDFLLGDDFDLPREAAALTNVGALGQAAVGSFIPFRGLVREVSGASGRQRALGVAVQAGYARRGFLKAMGQTKGCAYPARPASEDDIARLESERERALETAAGE